MRTYSHALLTWAAARRSGSPEPGVAVWGALGATLPDLPAIAGALWLGSQRRRFTRRELREEACKNGPFGGPDAALHSALPVGALLVLCLAFGAREHYPRRKLLAFLLGWAGHVLADALTHAEDARPILWPISRRRFRSPISYWERSRHARLFAPAEHGALLLVAVSAISRDSGTLRSIFERLSARYSASATAHRCSTPRLRRQPDRLIPRPLDPSSG